MRRVILESPFRGETPEAQAENIEYALAALRDCLMRGESPLASHLLLTQVLDDSRPDERALGIEAGHAWLAGADVVAVYTDRGISQGMEQGIRAAIVAGKKIEYRKLK